MLGAADVPVDPPPDWNPKGLLAKAEAGADFVQTQFCMDAGVVRRYAARLLELGFKLPILIGVAPIPSARSARWMREKLFGTLIPDAIVERLEKAADPKEEGAKICIELLQELAEIPGIAGAHVMAPQNFAADPARHRRLGRHPQEAEDVDFAAELRRAERLQDPACAAPARGRPLLFLHGASGAPAILPFMDKLARALRRAGARASGLRPVGRARVAREHPRHGLLLPGFPASSST